MVSEADRPHIRSRRSADLGDISAGASGILNEERKPPGDIIMLLPMRSCCCVSSLFNC